MNHAHFDDGVNRLRGGTSMGDVAEDCFAVAASRADAFNRFVQRGGAAAACINMGTSGSQSLRHRAAHP